MPKNVDDFRDVIDAYKRVDMSIEMARPLPENLTMSPHFSGHGMMIWGIDAYRKLQKMAEKVAATSGYAGVIEIDAVFQALIAETSSRFLRDGKSLTEREADRAVAAALKKAAAGIRVLTHFIPCRVTSGDEPTSFSIGPVRFYRWKTKQRELKTLTKKFISEASTDDNAATRADLARILLRYFKSFGWVAEIIIENTAPEISRRRAESVVQGAIDCLHVLMGARSTQNMRAGGLMPQVDRRGRITIDAEGKVEISAFVGWPEDHFRGGWWDFLNEAEQRPLVELLGEALASGRRAPKPTPLALRLMDSVAWYGEATRDIFQASRLVKFVTAVERILITRNEEDLADTIARRGGALLIAWGQEDLVEIKKSFKSVYNTRSQLVHGSRSPLDARLGKVVREAEKLSRLTILCALLQFGRDGLIDRAYKDDDLSDFFDRLVAFMEANGSSVPKASA